MRTREGAQECDGVLRHSWLPDVLVDNVPDHLLRVGRGADGGASLRERLTTAVIRLMPAESSPRMTVSRASACNSCTLSPQSCTHGLKLPASVTGRVAL
jgi:hypothetical protein